MSPVRRRLTGTAAVCGAASALFVGSQFLPGAEPSGVTVVVGLVAPAGVATLLWALKWGDARDLEVRTAWRPRAERVRRQVTR